MLANSKIFFLKKVSHFKKTLFCLEIVLFPISSFGHFSKLGGVVCPKSGGLLDLQGTFQKTSCNQTQSRKQAASWS